MNQERLPHHESPLDVVEHEGDAKTGVWMRRLLLVLLIGLCISFAAPTFGSCSGALGSGGSKMWGSFKVGADTVEVREADFQRASRRLGAFYRLIGADRPKDDDVWAQIMLDEVAKAEGIHVSDAQVEQFLASVPTFQTDGRFDETKYRDVVRDLGKYTGVDHHELTAGLKSILRAMTYRRVWHSAFMVPQSRAAYEEWKKTNVKLSADYVVQAFEPLVEKARALPVTDDDIRLAGVLNAVREMRAIPARRGFEAAYIRIRDVTDEQRAAMDAFAKEAHLFDATDKEATTESVAWSQFWGNHKPGMSYTRVTWADLQRPGYERRLAEWQKTPEPRDEKTKPVNPADEPWPDTPRDQFYKHWRPFVEGEVLARETLRHMAQRAERESKSFADLLPEYAKYGVKVVSTPEPITDAELVEKFPEGLGKDSDLEPAVRNQFRPPAPGAQFRPAVLPNPVQATTVAGRIEARGWIVVRWTSYEPARERELSEIREQIAEYYRGYRAHDLAVQVLDEVRKKAEAAGPVVEARRQALRDAASAAGLEVQHVRRFNTGTERAIPPVIGPGSTQQEKDAAAKVAGRGIVLDRYDFLSKLDVGKFETPIFRDDATGAAYLVMLTEKHEPGPFEMDEMTLRIERMTRENQARGELSDQLAPKELKKRYKLELTEDGRKATERNEEAGG